MVRTVYSPEYCLQYLENYASQETFVTGLILGQITEARENVIHLARTPEEKPSSETGLETESEVGFEDKPEITKSLEAVSEIWVADHAKHVTRMLPGGMFVQGIFIITEEEVFDDPNYFTKVKNILNHMYKVLGSNEYMYGNCPYSKERLVLHMSTQTKVLTCKSVEVGVVNTTMKPVEWKFVSKMQQWQRLDCYYEFDEVYPVIVKKSGISVKQQFQQILESAQKTINSSVMFIDGELKDSNDVLEQLVKKKKLRSGSARNTQQDAPKSMNVSLFVPLENSMPELVEYLECDGNIHFSGVVSSSVFMYPKATVNEAISAVKQDIIRSLASRFTMHCDALIDDNLLPEEKVCFNEPPRRVLVPVGSLYLCDYLFPGEAPAEALLSVKELLDLQITEDDVICDVETPADTSEFDALDRDTSSEELLATPQEASQFMYITGICFAMLVLIVSIIIHYYDHIVIFIRKLFEK